jgi:hypothetical protein
MSDGDGDRKKSLVICGFNLEGQRQHAKRCFIHTVALARCWCASAQSQNRFNGLQKLDWYAAENR